MGLSDERAFAFRYDSGEPAPKLLASGRGFQARKILEIATAAGVPVVEDPDLAVIAETMQVGDWIPEQLYLAFAELLAGIYTLNKKDVGREML